MSDRTQAVKVVRVAHETLWESIVSDTFTFAMLFGLVLAGKWIDSDALQWVGAIMGFLAVFARAAKKLPALTIEDARKRLDEIEESQ